MPRLSDFFKPKVQLPINFLRTVFQVGTGLYINDAHTPDMFGASGLAARGLFTFDGAQSDVIASIEDPQLLIASYFQNKHGNIIIHCEYDNSTPFDLDRSSVVLIIGHLNLELYPENLTALTLKTFFLFTGDYKKDALETKSIFSISNSDRIGKPTYKSVNIKDHYAVARSICFSDLCFLAVISGIPFDYSAFHQTILNYSLEELTSHYEKIIQRSASSLESQIQIVPNVPLKTYDTGPVI